MKARIVLNNGERKVLYSATIDYESRCVRGVLATGTTVIIPFEAIRWVSVHAADAAADAAEE